LSAGSEQEHKGSIPRIFWGGSRVGKKHARPTLLAVRLIPPGIAKLVGPTFGSPAARPGLAGLKSAGLKSM
jgi:hypothetical protein